MGRPFIVNTRGTAGKNESFRAQPGDFSRGCVEANNFRINLEFANPPGNDLCVLRTEIQDKNFRMRRCGGCLHATDEFAARRVRLPDRPVRVVRGRFVPGP
jgi:hypothetical protein